MLSIHKTLDGTSLTLALEGRLDTSTAPQLEDELKVSLSNVVTLIFDMKDLDYISSAGLRVLLYAQKTMNRIGKMEIINVSEEVMEIFEVTGFLDIFTVKQQ